MPGVIAITGWAPGRFLGGGGARGLDGGRPRGWLDAPPCYLQDGRSQNPIRINIQIGFESTLGAVLLKARLSPGHPQGLGYMLLKNYAVAWVRHSLPARLRG